MRKIAKPITKMAIFIAVFLSIGLFSLSADAVDINEVTIIVKDIVDDSDYIWSQGESVDVLIKAKWHWRWKYKKYRYYGFSATQNGVDITDDIALSHFERLSPWRPHDRRYTLEFELTNNSSGSDDIDLTIWVKNWSKTSETFILKTTADEHGCVQ